MRISSIALSTLIALIGWDARQTAQAISAPIAPPAGDGTIASSSYTTTTPAPAPPEVIVEPEFLQTSAITDLVTHDAGDRQSEIVTNSLVPETATTTVDKTRIITHQAAEVAEKVTPNQTIDSTDQRLTVQSASLKPSDQTVPIASVTPVSTDSKETTIHPAAASSPSPEIFHPVSSLSSAISHAPARLNTPVAAPLSPSLLLAQNPLTPDPNAIPTDRFPTEDKPEPLNAEDVESELGEIRVFNRPAQAPPPRRQPTVQLLLRSGIFSSSNTTALKIFQPSDTIFINNALLLATPKLGPDTRLIASIGGGLLRFANQGDANYNTVSLNVAVQQRLAEGTYGQLGWAQDTLYRDSDGQRLLRDNSIQLLLGRQDQLGKQLRLDSFYELKASFTNPDAQSLVANTLGARLRYDVTPKLQGALDYRLTFKSFTQVDRSDTEHQVSALAIYNISPDWFVAGSVSYLFGRSSNASIDVNNWSIGISLGLNLPLF